MRDDVRRDLSDSAYDFVRVVVPAIRDMIGGGEFRPVESVTADDFSKSLDMLAGIDAWQVITDIGIRGLASRIQWGPRAWRTFTIRERRPSGAKTELEKRTTSSADHGFIHPHLTVQAYITKPRRQGRLLAAGIGKTADIMEYIASRNIGAKPDWDSGCWRQENPADGVTFLCVPWDGFKRCGYDIQIAESQLAMACDG